MSRNDKEVDLSSIKNFATIRVVAEYYLLQKRSQQWVGNTTGGIFLPFDWKFYDFMEEDIRTADVLL